MTDILTVETIKMNGSVSSKEEAIRAAGELLVKGGCVAPEYIDGMLAREKTMSTYVGNGVAIPHGQFDDLTLIQKTGISVLQLPEGVEWEEGELAYIVVGIAATSDEHVNILANLAEAVEEPETVQQMAKTDDPKVIMEHLNREPEEDDDDFDFDDDDW